MLVGYAASLLRSREPLRGIPDPLTSEKVDPQANSRFATRPLFQGNLSSPHYQCSGGYVRGTRMLRGVIRIKSIKWMLLGISLMLFGLCMQHDPYSNIGEVEYVFIYVGFIVSIFGFFLRYKE